MTKFDNLEELSIPLRFYKLIKGKKISTAANLGATASGEDTPNKKDTKKASS